MACVQRGNECSASALLGLPQRFVVKRSRCRRHTKVQPFLARANEPVDEQDEQEKPSSTRQVCVAGAPRFSPKQAQNVITGFLNDRLRSSIFITETLSLMDCQDGCPHRDYNLATPQTCAHAPHQPTHPATHARTQPMCDVRTARCTASDILSTPDRNSIELAPHPGQPSAQANQSDVDSGPPPPPQINKCAHLPPPN